MWKLLPVLNDSQKDRLSETATNIGLIFFASMVMPLFVSAEEFNLFTAISGLVISTGFIVGSLLILKVVK